MRLQDAEGLERAGTRPEDLGDVYRCAEIIGQRDFKHLHRRETFHSKNGLWRVFVSCSLVEDELFRFVGFEKQVVGVGPIGGINQLRGDCRSGEPWDQEVYVSSTYLARE